MHDIPKDTWPDSTLALWREGYRFIGTRCERLQSDIFEARLLLEKTLFISGAEAARVFYRDDLFAREGAMPERVVETLLGRAGVQSLDGQEHQHRKQMFMALMSEERIDLLKRLTADHFNRAVKKWQQQTETCVFEEMNEILCRAACDWAGVPVAGDQVALRTAQMTAMISAPAAIGQRHRLGKEARDNAERWLMAFVDDVREGRYHIADNRSAAQIFCSHRDPAGQLLPSHTVAVELLNIIRPIVAIGRYITFMALALHQYPQEREKLFRDGEDARTQFVQEVRRFYPFFPAVAAIVKQSFTWQNHRLEKGQKVLLDLYGTNHDRRVWHKPEVFYPERFRHWQDNPFNFIPQGGGEYIGNHRCAGEWLTIELMKVVLYLLTHTVTYKVPEQDLHVNLARMPALPKSKFMITEVMPRTSRRATAPQARRSVATTH